MRICLMITRSTVHTFCGEIDRLIMNNPTPLAGLELVLTVSLRVAQTPTTEATIRIWKVLLHFKAEMLKRNLLPYLAWYWSFPLILCRRCLPLSFDHWIRCCSRQFYSSSEDIFPPSYNTSSSLSSVSAVSTALGWMPLLTSSLSNLFLVGRQIQ